MIICIFERFFNTANKMFYEIRPIYYRDGTVEFEVYYAYKDDADWVHEITKKTRASALNYIKSKGVK